MLRLKLIILIFIILFSAANAQTVIDGCGIGLPEAGILQKSGGTGLPLSGNLKILVVYCKFKDDNFDQSPHTDLWPSSLQGLPSWTSKTISGSVMSVYPDPSISSYFSLMSSGKLNVIGNVCPVLYTPKYEESYYYSSNGKNLSFLAAEIINGIDSYVNFADYDNNKDGIVDMIAVCFRTVKDFGKLDPRWGRYQGTASLTGSYTKFNYSDIYSTGSSTELIKDGVSIKPGFGGSGTIQNNIYDPDGQIPIIVHEIGHYFFGYSFNGSVHLPGIHHHGLMDTNGGGGIMNAYEREMLGWIKPRVISADQMNVILKDAVASSDVIKVNTPDGCYYFENFQGNIYYQKSWKYYNGGPSMTPGTGLRITRVNTSGSPRLIDVKTAGGKWKWKTRDGLYLYPFEHDVPNSKEGLDELQLISVPTTAGTKNHPDFLGLAKDFFSLGYNQVFSPWSNPSTEPDQNFAVELVSGLNSDLKLNFYFSDPQKGAPAKPKDLKIETDSSGKFTLQWPSNMESDMLAGGSYRIYRATVSNVDSIAYVLISTVSQDAGNLKQSFADQLTGSSGLPPGQASVRSLSYRVSAVDRNGLESVKSEAVTAVDSVSYKVSSGIASGTGTSDGELKVFPNPFNSSATVRFSLVEQGRVNLELFNSLGQRVKTIADMTVDKGTRQIRFDASDLPAGIYILRINAGRISQSVKIMHLK